MEEMILWCIVYWICFCCGCCWGSVKVLHNPKAPPHHRSSSQEKWWRNIPLTSSVNSHVPDSRRGHSSTLYTHYSSPITNIPTTTTSSPTTTPTAAPTTAKAENNNTTTVVPTNTNNNHTTPHTNTTTTSTHSHNVTKTKDTNKNRTSTAKSSSSKESVTTTNDKTNNKGSSRRLSSSSSKQKQQQPEEVFVEGRTYMIVSGGFSDSDWNTFPVWALDVTTALDDEEAYWIPVPFENGPPTARMGHASVIYEDQLYVFGGLVYNAHSGIFSMEAEHFLHRLNLRTLTWDSLPFLPANNATAAILPSTLMRGEVQGGLYNDHTWILYAGMHVKNVVNDYTKEYKQVDVPLADVWSYHFPSQTFTQLHDASGYAPLPRTAHAAVVVNDCLYTYGGLTKSSSSDSTWTDLSDLWEFHIPTQTWHTHPMAPNLERSYHSLVGYSASTGSSSSTKNNNNPTIASFGGYKSVQDPINNEPIAYVFDECLITNPRNVSNDGIVSWNRAVYSKSSEEEPNNNKNTWIEGITNRFEHSAVLTDDLQMIVWGGRFQTTQQVNDGIWILDLSQVEYQPASEEMALEEYQDTVAALYILVTTMMLVSMLFTYICGVVTRQTLEQRGFTTGGAGSGRGAGLRQTMIDALPITTASENTTCHICLVEYKIGDNIRSLPCQHAFHPACVDPWLRNNASCPVCRHTLQPQDILSPTTTNTNNRGSHTNDHHDHGMSTTNDNIDNDNDTTLTLELPSFPRRFSLIRRSRRATSSHHSSSSSSTSLFLPLATAPPNTTTSTNNTNNNNSSAIPTILIEPSSSTNDHTLT